ncbi:thioredoxin domain-containing protein [soil metagenome]
MSYGEHMANRLAESASPYLLQHADNPVDWWEWGPEAFDEARTRDVPLLISIGYSACHWCHVMAHESFEDPATAKVMNEAYVNIKVDREERPDVDSVYMEATQAMTGHGGWPMTVFVDHAGAPFFAGTYFPPQDRHGMPSFRSVLTAVSEAWKSRRSEVTDQANRLRGAIGRRLVAVESLPGESALAEAISTLASQFDPAHGGFGGAPKFPQQPVLEFLLRVHRRPYGGSAAHMLHTTLAAMAAGGIRDHLGGGFSRYSVDERWLVPHFEKMLYDNAQLARIYLWAGVEFDSDPFLQVAAETLEYILGDLSHPEGGLYSAEDADSEGVEGRFYVWDHAEFVEVGGADAGIAADYFGVTAAGNFEGATILHVSSPVAEVASAHGVEVEEAAAAIRRAGEALLERRSHRIRPGLDDKVVAAWNGLAIRALAEASVVLDEPRYLEAARRCARFVLDAMRDEEGRLHRSWAKGRVGPLAVLEDYGALGVGLLALYAVSSEEVWFEEALRIIEAIPALFSDPDGGFFTTGDDAEALVVRPKDQFDNPSPSGNSLAAEALALASAYTGNTDLWGLAEAAVRTTGTAVAQAPSAVGHTLSVLTTLLDGPRELAVSGTDATSLATVAWERFRPGLAVAHADRDSETVALLANRHRPGETLAYVCSRFVCEAPVSTPEDLRQALD